ncbi:hypothetical protein KQH82_07900 [bacterium]|nr:hypothetical protein [bacterium]
MTPARFRWGMLLILTGSLILLVNMDLINHNFVLELLIWFPIVLIAIGIEKIFTRSRLEFISYLTTVALVGAAVWIAFDATGSGDESDFFSRTSFVEEFDPAVEKIDALLDVGDGDLTIRDATRDMVYARFAEFTRKPKVSYEVQDGRALVEFSEDRGIFRSPISVRTDNISDWIVKFSDKTPLELVCRGDNSDMHLNMATTPLRKLQLEAPSTIVYVKIGNLEPEVKVSLFGSDADVKLRVPREAGLQINGKDYRSFLEKIGLIEKGDLFISEGFDTLQPKISVDLDERLRSLSIDTY